MIRIRWVALIFVFGLCADPALGDGNDTVSTPGTNPVNETVYLAEAAPFDRYAKVHKRVRRKCDLEAAVPATLAAADPRIRLVSDSELVSVPRDARVLEIAIHLAVREGAGLYPSIGVSGRLYEGGELVGRMTARRNVFELNNPTATFMNTCGVLEDIATLVAEDFSLFLDAPSMEARFER